MSNKTINKNRIFFLSQIIFIIDILAMKVGGKLEEANSDKLYFRK